MNSTANHSSSIEGSLLSLSFLSHLFSTFFHIDISSYIPYFILLSAFTAYLPWKHFSIKSTLQRWITSSIEIKDDDLVFEAIESWSSQPSVAGESTHRRVITGTRYPWRGDANDGVDDEHVSQEEIPKIYSLPHLTMAAATGSHFFWYQRYLIILRREESISESFFRETIYLRCFRWNQHILFKILIDAQLQREKRDELKTVIYASDLNKFTWLRVRNLKKRLFSTVFLNPDLQKEFLDDVEDYLNLETREWYFSKGIPYRRGYLFSGPPGTGKTSLCAAVAARFGLKVYVLSLNGCTDDGLNRLMSSLPHRCILLIEDIDVIFKPSSPEKDSNISLSAILNAIDGLLAPEGRILIISTNHKERLDPALIRPGRINRTFDFPMADRHVIKRLFLHIFQDHPEDIEVDKISNQLPLPTSSTKETLDEIDLEALADDFAGLVPEMKYSHAAILEYLIMCKKKPKLAIHQISKLVET